MEHEGISQSRISSGAIEAAVRLAHHLGIVRVDPVILHESQHVSIRLFPLDVVARVVVFADAEAVNRLTRELDVARHLVENAVPVVDPSIELPAGPHIELGFLVTLWEFVEHLVADEDNIEHLARPAEALHRVHGALDGFRSELPSFWAKIDRCGDLLKNVLALPALRAADRAFLLMVLNRLRASVIGLPLKVSPIMGMHASETY